MKIGVIYLSKNENVNEFKELAESLKERFAILPAGNFVDCETGEYLSKDEVDKVLPKLLQKDTRGQRRHVGGTKESQ